MDINIAQIRGDNFCSRWNYAQKHVRPETLCWHDYTLN